jgi:hypothetical protein
VTVTGYYASEDEGGTWSVYSEQYETADHDDPIDGTDVLIESGFPDMLAAEARVKTPFTPVAESDDGETCKRCGARVYLTQTATGTRLAHVGSKVIFCTPKSAR